MFALENTIQIEFLGLGSRGRNPLIGAYGYNFSGGTEGRSGGPWGKGDPYFVGRGLGGEFVTIPGTGTKDVLRVIHDSEVKNPARVFAFGDAVLLWIDLGNGERHVGGHSDLSLLRSLENMNRQVEEMNRTTEARLETLLQLDRRRHCGSVNVAFADGHVEKQRTLELSKPEMNSHWDRNDDPHLVP